MTDQNKPSRPSSDAISSPPAQEHPGLRPASPYVGRPLDGSQYLDVVEEQEYADRRPSPDEQRPRFSYRQPVPSPAAGNTPRKA